MPARKTDANPQTGTCSFCTRQFPKRGMTRHLQGCAARDSVAATTGKRRGKDSVAYHLLIEGKYGREYWIHLEVPGRATLRDLDTFLRGIWLECCGHLSAFTIGRQRFVDEPDDFVGWVSRPRDRSIDTRLDSLLEDGLQLDYEYDFGSTTHLSIRVASVREPAPAGRDVALLARNDPPDRRCEKCGKPARRVCTECVWQGGGWLCGTCAKKHRCGVDMQLPVVNSPRVGVCGYTGEVW